MKRVYLIRHAKSSWDTPGVGDHGRPLNERGQKDAPMMGKRLLAGRHVPDAMLSSTAVRAVTTAEAIAGEIGFPLARIEKLSSIYHAGPTQYYQILAALDDSIGSVFIFGHNPSISEFAHLLSGKPVGNLPTCAVYGVEIAVDSWKDLDGQQNGTVLLFDTPKAHRSD